MKFLINVAAWSLAFFVNLTGFVSLHLSAEKVREDFLYESKFVEVNGVLMHYADSEGKGDPILLVHGIPTWSYLWRNVMPGLEDRGRLIAVDLIGFGKSEKPSSGYKLADQVAYFEGFVDALELDNITLVVHDMGSFVGFLCMTRAPEKVKALVFMESMLTPESWEAMPQESVDFMQSVQDPAFTYHMVVNENVPIEGIIPGLTTRTLTDVEMNAYRQPFQTKEARESMVVIWPDFPISGKPEESHALQQEYIEGLKQSSVPKLMLTVQEPLLGTKGQIAWAKKNLSGLTVKDVGMGRHFVQEDQPENVSRAINDWMVNQGL